ncbi:hypothetical protein BDQ12DRAFT_750702 [Crucibulum laeve]|uniref:Uncharacterized protein n=1 Tax=Crucibulum laeve TaxID=68775 RepID=A0A5C3M876_9AGAR|nr:hypothetical protein BDQ12DRAFT_750702 [Crucibulum laeve]
MYHAQYRKHRLAEISKQRLKLNREHNLLIPIAVLPDDILLRVFLMSFEKEDEYDTNSMATMRYTSQVCSYWRDLTLGSPLHWCQINNRINYKSGTLWLEELLSRSKSSPLHVEIKFASKEELEFASTILQHSSRFCELEIFKDVPDPAFDDHLRSALENPMQYLHSLTIIQHVEGSNQTFFEPDAPSLRCLHLINTPMPFNASSFSTITELELSCDNASEEFTHALLYVLRDVESLKSLITNGGTAPPQMTTASIPFTGNVHLPYLEIMRLSGTLYHCAHTAISVEIPTSCFCSIICTGLDNSQRSNLPLMTQAITKILSRCRAPEALLVDFLDYGLYVYAMEHATILHHEFLKLVFGRNLDFRDAIHLISPFGNPFLNSVKHLRLGVKVAKDGQIDGSLHTLLYSCANVQTLELIGDDSVEIIFGLIQSHADAAYKILPILRALIITEHKAYDFKSEEVDSIILSLIKWRCDIGLPLKSIEFFRKGSRNPLFIDQVNKIEGLVVIYNE